VTGGLFVEDKIDISLPVQGDLFGAMFCHSGETQNIENWFQYACARGRKFNELKTVKAHWILKQVCHIHSPN